MIAGGEAAGTGWGGFVPAGNYRGCGGFVWRGEFAQPSLGREKGEID